MPVSEISMVDLEYSSWIKLNKNEIYPMCLYIGHQIINYLKKQLKGDQRQSKLTLIVKSWIYVRGHMSQVNGFCCCGTINEYQDLIQRIEVQYIEIKVLEWVSAQAQISQSSSGYGFQLNEDSLKIVPVSYLITMLSELVSSGMRFLINSHQVATTREYLFRTPMKIESELWKLKQSLKDCLYSSNLQQYHEVKLEQLSMVIKYDLNQRFKNAKN